MSCMPAKNKQAVREIEEIRLALGAIALEAPAVFWIFLGRDRLWRTRREGDPLDNDLARGRDPEPVLEMIG